MKKSGAVAAAEAVYNGRTPHPAPRYMTGCKDPEGLVQNTNAP